MTATPHTLRPDPEHGFLRLEPRPTATEVQRFYEERYYPLVAAGERGPDVRRLTAGGAEADAERHWLADTLYRDVRDLLRAKLRSGGRTVLEVGCGSGDLLAHLATHGYDAHGIELAPAAASFAASRGLDVVQGRFEDAGEAWLAAGRRADAVLFMNVLEQLHDPVDALRLAHRLLAPGGVVIVRSGNDFNALQLAAREALECEPWWVAIPDQVSYFSFETMTALLEGIGFDVIHRQADFPMELFLLLGFDYIRDRGVGRACHERRRAMELTLPVEVRRQIYEALADAGVGRCMLLVARRGMVDDA